MLRIKLKGISNAETWSPIFCLQTAPPPPLTLGLESIGQKSTILEHGHVAYQIKWNHEMQQHGNMVANSLPADPPPPPPPATAQGDGVNRTKFNFYRTWSCCISN